MSHITTNRPRQSNFLLSNNKIIICGDIVENYIYENPYIYNLVQPASDRTLGKDSSSSEKQKYYSIKRAKDNLRRIINSNIYSPSNICPLDSVYIPYRPLFLTLTFASDIFSHYTPAIRAFRAASRYLTEHLPSPLLYIAVSEVQKRNVYHFHLICFNVLPYPKAQDPLTGLSTMSTNRDHLDAALRKAWPYGHYKLQSTHKIKNAGAYLSKYLGKNIASESEIKNKKRYYCSRHLLRPLVVHNASIDKVYNQSMLKVVVARSYYHKKLGDVKFIQYKKLSNVKAHR